MQILLFLPSGDPAPWLTGLARHLPQAQARSWKAGDDAPADYALVWKPTSEVLCDRAGLKAVFNLGAGVDALLPILQEGPEVLPAHIPLIRLDDAGMGAQMVEYVSHAVLRRFRRLDEYQHLHAQGQWQTLEPRERSEYRVGVMGVGTLGAQVASALAALGFPVAGWSRSRKALAGVECFAGDAERDAFLDDLQVLVNMLPLTPETDGLLDRRLFARLRRGAHLINVARGAHVVDDDLLAALADGQLGHATLDVFREEPLPPNHPFWREARIDITPHVSALTEREASLRQIADKISALERGERVAGTVDRNRGY